MKNFWIRTLSAIVYVALFVFCIYAGEITGSERAGVLIFTAFVLFVTIGGTFEFFRIVEKQGAKPMRIIGFLLSGLVCAIISLSFTILDFSHVAFGLVFLFFILFPTLLILQLWRKSDQPFRDVAYTVLPALYIALPLSLMPFIAWVSPNLMMSILALVWINDSCAYMGGSLCGRHKMWPRHSPGKTWEGTAIGVAITIAIAVFVGPLFVTDGEILLFGWILIGVICSVIGTLGDLVESMLKRSVDMKDSGNIMPGHGGFLDRFDSLLIIMPFIFIIVIFLKEIQPDDSVPIYSIPEPIDYPDEYTPTDQNQDTIDYNSLNQTETIDQTKQ